MFVVHLMQFKWDEAKPFPAYKTIAERMAVSDKTARRFAVSLQGKGYLQREMRVAQTNRFDLSQLMAALVNLKNAQMAAKQEKEDKQ
jgi:DeoR/GlpR family transcriptional regulator of sugar metabolism